MGVGEGEGEGEGSGGAGGLIWALIWLIVLWFLAWPIAFFIGWLYIFLLPFSKCIPDLKDLADAILKIVQLPGTVTTKMLNQESC